MTPAKYKPGDRVIGTAMFLRDKSGHIEKTGRGVTAMVLWDGADRAERVDLDSMRPEAAEDVAAREHARRMREWRETMPDIKVARIEHCHRWQLNDETGVSVTARTPDEMRAAARELVACADWFEGKPG